MRPKEPLCQPYDPFREQPGIYSKIFLPGKIHVSLRPFHIEKDLALINDWLNFQFANSKTRIHDPFQYTEDYYTTLLAGNNSQPLLGTIDQQPAFQADIYQSVLGPDSLLQAYNFAENDYIMQLMMSPETMQNLSLSMYMVLASLDCFFNYTEVDRITWMTNTGEKNFRFIAGIIELDEIKSSDSLQSFYIISKEQFRAIQFSLPQFPEEQPMAMGC